MIITKSVSRFARNLLDCIGWVRELKDKHDPPIAVFFEQEHLNTLDTTSNIILFVLAMQEVQSMPAYPKKGSLQVFDDVLVVKLS